MCSVGLEDVLRERNVLAKGSGIPPAAGGSGGGTRLPLVVEEEMAWVEGRMNVSGGTSPTFLGFGIGPVGGFSFEGDTMYRAPSSRTIQKGKLRIAGNSLTAPTTFVLRIAGADTAFSVTVGASTDGDFPFPGTVSVVEGATVSMKAEHGGGFGSIDAAIFSYEAA